MLKKKDIIGTVSYMGGLPALLESFCWDWGQLIAYNGEYLCKDNSCIYYTKAKVSTQAEARNSLVRDMRGDWLFMLDTDHTFDPDILERMLKVMDTYNISILSGLYGRRNEDSAPTIYRFLREEQKFASILTWHPDLPLIPVEGTGGGCLLIKKEVFKRIKEELREEPFSIIPPFIEDLSFFVRCIKLGIPAFCCPFIEAKHLRLGTVNIEERIIPLSLLGPFPQMGNTAYGS